MKKKNRFVCSVCFKAPPVSLTACHFRQIFRSVTFLQKMESQHTLRIKWFHIIFHRLVFLHSNSAAAGLRLLLLLCKKIKMEAAVVTYIAGIEATSPLTCETETWTCRRGSYPIAWHSWKKYMCKELQCISHVTVNVSQSCFSSQHGCCAFYFIFFLTFYFFSEGVSTSLQ